MPLFDVYMFIDWSGAAAPGGPEPSPDGDEIWIGEILRGVEGSTESYCDARETAIAHLIERLQEHVEQRRRVLLGFDFAYAYPAGFAAALKLDPAVPAWRAVWDAIAARITDDEWNQNNRLIVAGEINLAVRSPGHPGPFWGRHHQTPVEDLPVGPHVDDPIPTATGIRLAKHRLTEGRAGGRIKSTWQLFYPGAVGGQVLMGLPRLRALRFDERFASLSKVWPFETGFTPNPSPAEGPFILHAEIWPSVGAAAVDALMAAEPGLIRDEAQVRVMCDWARDQDSAGTLGEFFERPAGMTDEQLQTCVSEEGWILGVK